MVPPNFPLLWFVFRIRLKMGVLGDGQPCYNEIHRPEMCVCAPQSSAEMG